MNERGFTLVELLISMTLSLGVFGLVGTSLVVYQNDAQRSTRQNDSQDNARTAIDRIVRELRDVASFRATPSLIEAAGPYDLVFQTISSTPPPAGTQNPTGVSRVRYCIPSDSAPVAEKETLMVQTQTWTTANPPANPWPITAGSSTSCPSSPSAATGTAVSTAVLAEDVMNRFEGANRPAFSYDSTTLSQITTVGIELFVDASPTQAPDATSLRSAAFLRNQNQAPVATFTATPTGGGHLLLNGGGSSDPDNQGLTYQWFKVVGGTATPIGSSGMLDWVATPGDHMIRLTVTDAGGLSSTLTRTEAVS